MYPDWNFSGWRMEVLALTISVGGHVVPRSQGQTAQLQNSLPPLLQSEASPSPLLLLVSDRCPGCAHRWCLCHLPPPSSPSYDPVPHAVPSWIGWSGREWGGMHISTGCRWDVSASMIPFFQQMVPHACRMKSQDQSFRNTGAHHAGKNMDLSLFCNFP